MIKEHKEFCVKVVWRKKKWRLGGSYGWWNVPYCPHCKRCLGTLLAEKKPPECDMCHKPITWE